MKEILDIIRNRRSIRRFLQKQLEDDVLGQIIEAGRYAPSGGNNQTSHMIVIQNAVELEELRKLVEEEFCKMEYNENTYKSLIHSIEASQKGNYRFHYDAPTLIVVANRIGYGNAMADSACLLENMMIAAASLGVGTCWINQLHWLDENPNIRQKLYSLGLETNETICGGLALGYPVDTMKQLEPLKRVGNPVTYIR
jgi:nitroreductase